jgi:hypothetical protein
MKTHQSISIIVLLALALSPRLGAQTAGNPQFVISVSENRREGATNTIWLGPKYQTPADKFDSIEKYPWKDVPRGKQTFGNVPLYIGGMICTWGESNARNGLNFPEQVTGLRIGQKCEAIYLYHTAFSKSGEGTAIVQAVFRYKNNVSVTNDLCYGVHVRDWFLRRGDIEVLKDAKSKMVWRGVNSTSRSVPPSQLRFFITEIVNQHPEVPLLSLDLYSARQESTYCLLAITTGPAGLLKVDPQIQN